MANLYEICKGLALYEMEFNEDGEWVNEQELTDLKMEKDEKIENLLLWVKNMKADAKAIKEEEDTLKSRRKLLEKKIERILNYVASALNGEKFETAKVKVNWRKSESVEIVNPDEVPEEFLKNEVVKTPMKDEIKKHLKALGDTASVAWAKLVTKNNMSIK